MGRVKLDRSKAQVVVRRAGLENLQEYGRKVLRNCQEECPVQTGRLLRSHRLVRVSWREVRIEATAPYSLAVFDGKQGRRPNRWLLRGLDRSRIG